MFRFKERPKNDFRIFTFTQDQKWQEEHLVLALELLLQHFCTMLTVIAWELHEIEAHHLLSSMPLPGWVCIMSRFELQQSGGALARGVSQTTAAFYFFWNCGWLHPHQVFAKDGLVLLVKAKSILLPRPTNKRINSLRAWHHGKGHLIADAEQDWPVYFV